MHGWECGRGTPSPCPPSLSAAGRGGDGTLQVAQGTVRGVHWDGDGEVEDGGGGGGASVEHSHGGAAGLSRAVWGQHLGLELQQLAHETEVGGDDAPSLLHKLEGLVQPDPVSPHEVSKADGGRAGDARLAVHKHSPSCVLDGVWKGKKIMWRVTGEFKSRQRVGKNPQHTEMANGTLCHCQGRGTGQRTARWFKPS